MLIKNENPDICDNYQDRSGDLMNVQQTCGRLLDSCEHLITGVTDSERTRYRHDRRQS